MIKAVIYDFDGTLADTLKLHYDAYVYSLLKCGVNANKAKVIDKCFNKQDIQVANSFGIDVNQFSKYYRQRVTDDFKNVKLYPEVLSTFESINIPIAIATSRTRRELDSVFNILHLNKYCHISVTHDKVNKKKVDIFIKACEYLKVKFDEVIIVGDAETDLESANQMNATSVLYYPDSHQDYYNIDKLKKYNPYFIIKNHKEIIAILQRLNYKNQVFY